ncbi:filamentous hemagglutinin N-terminal domain-containing protein [Rhodovulum sp. DZ06]|uniref:two-partner secretion domain-containing protein n=1 Tax=Rhodovulum sp. DZ06 TaxID=3425126 RepID=UPI003D34BCE8
MTAFRDFPIRPACSLAALAAALPGAALAGPYGETVVGGAATVTRDGSVTTIEQSTDRTVIEWTSFDTDAHETTRFVQPDADSIAVNRVRGDLPTNIRGALLANGNVVVINRNGVVFHETARVDVNGLVATTADTDTAAFMAGSNRFDIAGEPGAQVVNRGSITFAEAGLAALVGPNAANEGVITGRLGRASVEGRETFAIDVSGGDGILALEAPGVAESLSALNTGTIAVEGGYVEISAAETAAALESLAEAGGSVSAGELGTVVVEGAHALVTGEVRAAGGAVHVRGDAVEMGEGALIDVSGATGGGVVSLGGGLRGEGRVADSALMREGSAIIADGVGDADGGLVTLWSESKTGFFGDISAKGGAAGGDGGFVEVSSLGWIGLVGDLTTAAPMGEMGTFLLDPGDIIFTSSGLPATIGDFDNDDGGSSTVRIAPADVAALSANSSLIFEARDDIRVEEALNTANANVSLTLRAGDDILIDASITVTGDLTLSADHDFSAASVTPGTSSDNAGDGIGQIVLDNGADLTAGGTLTLGVGADADQAMTFLDTGDGATYTVTATGALELPKVLAQDAVTFNANDGVGPGNEGAISQAAGATIVFDDGDPSPLNDQAVTFNAGSGAVTLGNSGNDVTVLHGSAGAASTVVNFDDLDLAFDAGTAALDVTLENGGATLGQDGAIVTSALSVFLTGGGAVTLDRADNVISSFGGAFTGALTLQTAGDLDLAFSGAAPTSSIDITTTAGTLTPGHLTSSGDAITAAALTLDLSGGATLTDAGNSFATLTAQTGAASSFATTAGGGALTLGTSDFGGAGADIDATGATSVGQSGAVSGILSVASPGAITLTDAGNDFTGLTVSQGAASAYFSDPDGGTLTLGASTLTGGASITVGGTNKTLAQTGALSGGTLALDVSGDAALADAVNDVGQLTGTVGGDLAFRESGDLDLGIGADTMTITATGSISDSLGPVTTTGAANFFAFDEGAAGNILDDAYGNVTFADAGTGFGGPVSAVGDVLSIATAAALTVEDAHADGSASFHSDAALTLSRVSVGLDTGGGATVELTVGGDLLATSGVSIEASDIQAGLITLGDGASVVGAPGAGTLTSISLDRFDASGLALGAANATLLGRASSPGLILSALPSSGDLTLRGLDLTGSAPIVHTGGTLRLDGITGDNLDITAPDVGLGFIDLTGNLVVRTSGSILSLTNAEVAIPGGYTVAAPVFASAAQGPDVSDVTVAGAAPTNLIRVGGTATLTAENRVFLVGADPDETGPGDLFFNDFGGVVTVIDGDDADLVGLDVALVDANDLVIGAIDLDGAEAGTDDSTMALQAGAGGAGSLTQAGALALSGRLVAVAADDVTLTNAGNVLFQSALKGANVALHSTIAQAVTVEADVDASVTSDAAATVTGTAGRDMSVTGPFTLVRDVVVGRDLTVSATAGNADVSDAAVERTATVTARGLDATVRLADVRAGSGASGFDGALRAEADGGMDLVGVDVETAATLVSGQDSGSFDGGLRLANVGAGSMSALARDTLDLGPTSVSGDLTAQSVFGSIIARDAAGGAASGPGATAVGAVGPQAFRVSIHDVDGSGGADTVGFDMAARAASGFTPVAATDGLVVGGAALFAAASALPGGVGNLVGAELNPLGAAQNVTLAPGADGLRFDFNTVALRVDGDATLHDDAGGFGFDVPSGGIALADGSATVLETSGSLATSRAVDVSGNLTVTTAESAPGAADGHVTDAPDDTAADDVAQADGILVRGVASFTLEGDLALDGLDGAETTAGIDGRTQHAFLGRLDVTAANASVSSVSTLKLGTVTAQNATFRSAGDIVDSAGRNITVTGAATFDAWDDKGDADPSNDTGGAVSLTGASHRLGTSVSAAGTTVDIRVGVGRTGAAADLNAADIYGASSVFLSARRDVNAARVTTGTLSAAGGGGAATNGTGAVSVAAGRDASLSDVIAGSLSVAGADPVNGAALGAVSGSIGLERFDLGSALSLAAGTNLVVRDGDAAGSATLSAGTGALTVSNIDAGAATVTATAGGSAAVSGVQASSLDIQAADVTLGFVDVTGALAVEALSGDITTDTDAALAGLIPSGATVNVAAAELPEAHPASTSGTGIINDVTLARAGTGRLISAASGDFTAAGDILLPGTTAGAGFENDLGTAAFDGGLVMYEDANGLTLAGVSAASLALRLGADAAETGSLAQTGAVSVSGTTTVIVDADTGGARGDVTLANSANSLGTIELIAGNATLGADAGGFTVNGAQVDGALSATGQTGDIALVDVTADSVQVATSGAATAQRVAAAAQVSLSGAVVSGTDVTGGDIFLSSPGDATLTRFSGATVDIFGEGDVEAIGGAANALRLDAFGTVLARNITAADVYAIADLGITVQALRQTDAARGVELLALAGDVQLGRVATAGDLAAEAQLGAVVSRDASDGAAFAAAGSAVAVAGANAVAIGVNPLGDDRVNATTAGGGGAFVASPAVGGWLNVGGNLLAMGQAGVSLRPADDLSASSVAGSVMIDTPADAVLEIGGEVDFGIHRTTSVSGAALSGFAADVGGALRVRSGAAGGAAGGITQDAGAAIRVAGAADFVTGVHAGASLDTAELAGISLADGGNSFGGTVSALGSDVSIAASGDLLVQDAIALADGGGAGGALTLSATGALGVSRAESDLDMSLTGATVAAADLLSRGSIGAAATAGALTLDRAAASADLQATATGEMSVSRLESGGDMRLGAGSGDLRLGRILSGGALAAESAGGAIRVRPSPAGTDIAGASFNGAGADQRTPAVGSRGDVALTASAAHLDVAEGAAFLAAGDIALPGVSGVRHDLAGGVALQAGGSAVLAENGDLVIGIDANGDLLADAADLPAFASGATIANGVSIAGAGRINVDGTVTDVDGATLTVGSGLTIDAAAGADLSGVTAPGGMEIYAEGADVTLGIAGPTALNIIARSLTVETADDLDLGAVILEVLDVTGTGAAAQTLGAATVAPSYVTTAATGAENAAVLTVSAPGALPPGTPATSLSAAASAALADAPAVIVTSALRIDQAELVPGTATPTGPLSVILDNGANILPADVQVTVNGAVSLAEEQTSPGADALAYAAALGLGETALLQFNALAAGGDITIISPDQIQFMDDVAVAVGAKMLVQQQGFDVTAAGPVANADAAVIFRGDVGGADGTVGGADLEVLTHGDIYFFGTVGAGDMDTPLNPGGVLGALTPGGTFAPFGSMRLSGFNIVAGARPEAFAGDAQATLLQTTAVTGDPMPDVSGLVQLSDLRDFVTDLGGIDGTVVTNPTAEGALGEVHYQLTDGTVKADFLQTVDLVVSSDDGAIMFVINRPDAGGEFEDLQEFFGIRVGNGIQFEQGPGGLLPGRFEGYGMIDGDRGRTAGVRVLAPVTATYFFNGCRVRSTSDCTQLGTALTLPPLPPIDVPVLEVEALDLTELFGAIGNEDLWRLPPVYLEDRLIAGANAGADEEEENE